MPTRTYTWRRWQVAVAFVAITLAFVLGIWRSTTLNNRTNDLARRAHALALSQKRIDKRVIRIRDQQVLALYRQAKRSCQQRHTQSMTLQDIIRDGQREARLTLQGPLAELPGVREAVQRGLVRDKVYLRRLRKTDCTHLPPLPTRHHK